MSINISFCCIEPDGQRLKGWATGKADVSIKRKIQERIKAEELNAQQWSFQVKQFLKGHLELWQVNIERKEFARGKKSNDSIAG